MKIVETALKIGTAVALFFAANSASCQTNSHQRHDAEFQSDLVHRLVGLTVENADGEKLGVIKNFIMDMQSGQAKYALISSGGFIGVGSHLKIAPAPALSTATAKKGVVSLDVSQHHWAGAPVFRKGDLLKLSEPAWSKRIALFYGQLPPGTNAGAAAAPAVARTSRAARSEQAGDMPSGSLRLASDIVGRVVINRHQEVIGEISDLLVDLGGLKSAFAIISSRKSSKHEESFAVPLRSLSAAARNKFALDADRRMFTEAKPFDKASSATPGTNSTQIIYKFEGR